MCGIFTLLNNSITFTPAYVDEQFQKGKKRGPEYSKLSQVGIKIMMGIHHLSTEGFNLESAQPIIDGDIVLICDGNIFNSRHLFNFTNMEPKTNSDCEIIIHLYKKYGIEHTLHLLDGHFAFILLDNSVHSENFKMYVARDPYGVRPLYIMNATPNNSNDEKHQIIGFASEVKVLYDFYKNLSTIPVEKKKRKTPLEEEKVIPKYGIKQFPPGTYSSYYLSSKIFSCWTVDVDEYRYHSTAFNSIMYHLSPQYYDTEVIMSLQCYTVQSVEKLCCSTERQMACLLSGGLESSIIAGLVNEYHVRHKLPQLETYSIGLEGCDDLKYAKKVAEHLNTKHTEIVLKEEDFLKAIPEVIQAIETYDVATVRASIPHYLLGKYISENSKAKIIFGGDGANELFGGYLYMYLAYESMEFDKEVRRLFKDCHNFNLLRAERCLGSHGLDIRLPFLDREFVQYYLSIPPQIRFHTRNEKCEKFFLRLAFSKRYFKNCTGGELLPEEVIWRTTEEFADGISGKDKLFCEVLQDYANFVFVKDNRISISSNPYDENMYTSIMNEDPMMKLLSDHLLPKNTEQYLYRKEFEKHYSGLGNLVPYYWMPKYANRITDPSARNLEIYDDESENDEKEKSEEKTDENTVISRENNNDEEITINIYIDENGKAFVKDAIVKKIEVDDKINVEMIDNEKQEVRPENIQLCQEIVNIKPSKNLNNKKPRSKKSEDKDTIKKTKKSTSKSNKTV
jgi:asparagine synthase (glutamine-hydrolysing)